MKLILTGALLGAALTVPLCFACTIAQVTGPASSTSVATIPVNGSVHGHRLGLVVGQRFLDNGFWSPLDEQTSIAVEFAATRPDWPIGYEVGIAYSTADDELLGIDVEVQLLEIYGRSPTCRRRFGVRRRKFAWPLLGVGIALRAPSGLAVAVFRRTRARHSYSLLAHHLRYRGHPSLPAGVFPWIAHPRQWEGDGIMSTKTALRCALAVTLLAPLGASQAGSSIHVRAWIDGRSRLILDDATATWQHFDFAAPGRLNCNIGAPTEPTYLDGMQWWPVWPDVPDCENRNCGGCTSDTYLGLGTPVPNSPFAPSLSILTARGPVDIVEYPSPANGYRVVIEFNDTPSGADWYEFDLVNADCAVVPYCTSLPNSTGVAATIDLTGSMSVSGSDTELLAWGCPPNRVGLFVYGRSAVQMPFCNGILCVSPYAPGLLRIPALVAIDSAGTARCPLDFKVLPPNHPITGGSTWYFQFFFRDHAAGGSGANLTNGARVTFCP